MKRSLACALLIASASSALAAEPCQENFKTEGNFLTGKTYKTWAVIPGLRLADAFGRAQAFTVANGFTVLSADKEAGVISAAQSVSYGQGKSVPLGIVMQPEGDGLKISVNYATSGGVVSPEGAIKTHFCGTIAAAANGSAAGAPANSAAPASQAASPQTRRALRGYASASPEQQQRAKSEILKNVPNDRVRQPVKEAAPAIAAYIEQLSCLNDGSGASALSVHSAPGHEVGMNWLGSPMRAMQYHDKASCLTITRVHGWTSPANNALKFEAVYTADDSGETQKRVHEAIRQPDGTWLFTQ